MHIYQFNLSDKGSKTKLSKLNYKCFQDDLIVSEHEHSDDHTDVITSMAVMAELGLFITSSRDCTIKLWDTKNNLVR